MLTYVHTIRSHFRDTLRAGRVIGAHGHVGRERQV